MRLGWLGAMLVACYACYGCASAAEPMAGEGYEAREVALTMIERAGHDRVNEPVRIGVPLPKGAVKSVEKMTLFDADGSAVPCQFTPVCRWVGDESVKWGHLDFVTSIPAKATKTLRLAFDEGRNPPPKTPIVVKKDSDAVTVTTGAFAVRLRGKNFNLFDSATLDGKPLIKSADGAAQGIILQTDAGEFGSAFDPDGTVEVEREGPICAVVKCEGALKDKEGKKSFDYCVRFYFYAGVPRVRAAFTYVNKVGGVNDKQEVKDLSVVLPTTALDGVTAVVGTEKQPVQLALGPRDIGLSVSQNSSDEYVIAKGVDKGAGVVEMQRLADGKGKSTKPLTTGWGALTRKDGGVAAGWRWFWQTFPSEISLGRDGTIRLGLYPASAGKSVPVWMGQARTHYLTFVFGPEAPERLNDIFAGSQKPLQAFPDTKYLCRQAAPFGPIAESDPKLFGDLWERLKNYDAECRKMLDSHIKRIDGATYQNKDDQRKFFIEGYGYREWGDAVLWLYPTVEFPWNVSWSGNYYDFSFACLLQFLRTGDFDYVDQFEPFTMHEADSFTANHHPTRPDLIGACRYCPPRNLIGNEDSGTNRRAYISVEFNHHKAMSTFALWYLLGDERMRDVALLKLNNAFANREADNGWRQCRGPGAQLATLYMGYEMTHDPKYLERMVGIVDRAERQFAASGSGSFAHSGGKFMYGIAMEGILYEYWLTGDTKTLALVKGLADYLLGWLKGAGRQSMIPNVTFAFAFLYHETGDEKYRDAALKCLDEAKGPTWGEVKHFGQAFRNVPRALYYVAVPPRKPPVKPEQ